MKTRTIKIKQPTYEGMMQVCRLLQWSQQQYCDYLFEQYCQFIKEKHEHFPDIAASHVLYSPVFRGMFNNAAALRDEIEFTPFALEVTERITVINAEGALETIQSVPLGGDYLIEEWKSIHSYERLMNDAYFLDQFHHILRLI